MSFFIPDPPYFDTFTPFELEYSNTGKFNVVYVSATVSVNNYSNEEDFSILNNRYLYCVEYIESNVLTLPLIGMPCVLRKKDKYWIQENNVFSSFLKLNPQKRTIGCIKDGICYLRSVKYFVSGHIMPKIQTQVTHIKQEIEVRKKDFKKKTRESSIIKWNIVYTFDEFNKWNRFFGDLSKKYDPNNLIIMIYALSCFPLHNLRIEGILKKINKFYNFALNWTNCINYICGMNTNQNSWAMNNIFFELKFLKLMHHYFTDDKIFELDISVKKGSVPKAASPISRYKPRKRTDSQNIKNAIKKLFELEILHLNHLMVDPPTVGVGPNRVGNVKVSEAITDFLGNIFDLDYKDKDPQEMEFVLARGFDEMMGLDFETFDYDIEKVKGSMLFKTYRKMKDKKNEGKDVYTITKKQEIRYSKVLFEISPHILSIHNIILKKFSNKYSVFCNFKKSKKWKIPKNVRKFKKV